MQKIQGAKEGDAQGNTRIPGKMENKAREIARRPKGRETHTEIRERNSEVQDNVD